ncbi:MAG TPA: dienelactone hydrolase family protein [Candidatus Limnocylindria bacterium]|jgi:carboxymethylenebutenolidase|nr:dienelactone hydrolase family protein [Candidatus Limnocylindria bacterium]
MCYPTGARPPAVPPDVLAPMSGGAGGDDYVVRSADGTEFRTYLARAASGDAGVIIAPDVRGLHPFYEELTERFASAGVHAMAFDYFGRTAGTDRRGDDFEFMPHVQKTRWQSIQADITAAAEELRKKSGASRVFVLGFCMGGRVAFIAAAEQTGLAGVVGFYGRLSTREGEEGQAPIDKVPRMTAPVLGLFGGADGGIPEAEVKAFDEALTRAKLKHDFKTYRGAPHSFFDRTFTEHKSACDDAWRRVLKFMKSGNPAG